MNGSQLIPVKYNLINSPDTLLYPDFNNIHDELPDQITKTTGFKPLHIIPARISSEDNIPVINKKIYTGFTIRYNYILAFNHDGILFLHLEFNSGQSSDESYQCDGLNGFIDAKDITNINLSVTSFSHISVALSTKINTYHIILRTHYTKAFDLYNNSNANNHSSIAVSGNRLNLLKDPTYLNSSNNVNHIKNLLIT